MLCGVLLCGCGGDEADVTGKITLDGWPLADATVSFVGAEVELPPAFATTDENGEFVLQPSDGEAVAPGKYLVRVTTFQPAIDVTDPPTPVVPEKVPMKYNIQTTLSAEVGPEMPPFEFALDSKGQIVQPREQY